MTAPILVELYVMGIALDSRTGTPIMVLNDKENRRALPIWIGTAEASAIIRQLEGIQTSRPMTHDLVYDILKKTGYTVTQVEINDLDSDTYFASIVTEDADGESMTIDARPSDAVAIALKCDCPIYATSPVIAEGTITTDRERDEEEAEEFREFIQNITPSDFKKYGLDDESAH